MVKYQTQTILDAPIEKKLSFNKDGKTPLMLRVEKKLCEDIRIILRYYYERQNFSWERLSILTGVSEHSLRDWAKYFGIRKRNRSEAKKIYSARIRPTRYAHIDICLCVFCKAFSKECDFEPTHEKGRCIAVCSRFDYKPGSYKEND